MKDIVYAPKVMYSTKEDLVRGFSDNQLTELMENMTIFAATDFCLAPCNMCAFKAKKTPGAVMDIEAVDWFYRNFANDFNFNQPMNHATDNAGYRGRNGENYLDVLMLHKEYHTYYPKVKTGMPPGADQTLVEILNADFVSPNHSGKPGEQLVVPEISRHKCNEQVVDAFLRRLGIDPNSVESGFEYLTDCGDTSAYSVGNKSFLIDTVFGERILRVKDIEDFTNSDNKVMFIAGEHEGVAVFPTGFYRYDPAEPSFGATMKRKITPEDFRIQKRTECICMMFLDDGGNEVTLKVDPSKRRSPS